MAPQNKLVTKVTNAGTPYTVIMPPNEVTYDYVSINNAGKLDDVNDHWMIYLTKKEVMEKGFPLNANPRKPNSVGTDESKDIVVKMQSTIMSKPKDFVRLNNGLTAVATDVRKDYPSKGKVTVKWGEMEGILNGGHTYLALQMNNCPPANHDLVKVKLELIELDNKFTLPANEKEKTDLIKQTAMARNANRQLKDYTQSEFEGLHERFQSHLGDLKGVVYWSEGYEEIATHAGKSSDPLNPVKFVKNECMDPYSFVRYLAILDREWYWHPTGDESDAFVAPTKENVIKELVVKGATTYKDWEVIAIIDSNEKNLNNPSPLSRMLIFLHDRITSSMNLVEDKNGKTLTPVGCGSSFTTMKVFANWCGKSPNGKPTLSDRGNTKTAKSTPHFIGYMMNFVRPFIWYGDTEDDDRSYVGWYHDPLDIYDEFHKDVIKNFMYKKYSDFDSGRDMVKDGLWCKDNWDNYVLPLWKKHCSIDEKNQNFYPAYFFDYESEDWLKKDKNGDIDLIFNKVDKQWRAESSGKPKSTDDHFSTYSKCSPPY